jgi:4-aminobutyrate aminotransferase/(S)-3-amino-2-methylpropionate transaminase
MGDPARALLFGAIYRQIQELDLVNHTAQVGKYLFNGLTRLQQAYPDQITNLRGKDQGTFIAFDSPKRDELLKQAKTMGINLGGSGVASVRLRPMLVFQQHHGKFTILKYRNCKSIRY